MTAPAQSTWQIIEDALYQLILGNMPTSYVDPNGQPGGSFGTVLAIQPNPDGSTGLANIERVTPPTQNRFPSVGLMCTSGDENPSAIATLDSVTTFAIALTVRRAYNAAVADTEAAALVDLRNYQNDGQGNGLEPLLRANVTVMNLCQWSYIKHFERAVLTSDASSADVLATAFYVFETHDQLRTNR